MDTQKSATYKRWYEKHKAELAEKRKLRYRQDPAYREKALEQKRRQTEKARLENKIPAGYVFTMQSVAEHLGITVWTMREWRRKDYFPEPMKFGRNLFFSNHQAGLLEMIKKYVDDHGPRMDRASREKMVDLINLVHANWS